LNKGAERSFALDIAGLPGARVNIAGVSRGADGRLLVDVGQDQTREVRLSVQADPAAVPKKTVDIEISATDVATGQTTTARDHFVPGSP
ncbi:MAG: cytochrome c oxidase accessory protein CcoG, partial [Bradyrhizobium icense]